MIQSPLSKSNAADTASAPTNGLTPGVRDDWARCHSISPARSWLYLATLIAAYIGIYLCRKNFSVAIPLLQKDLGVTKEQVGMVASVSTLAYALGKFIFGPNIDRLGGRFCFLLSLAGVAIFGAMGGMVTGLTSLTWVYSANRLAGSAGWGGMVKLVPDWFNRRQMPVAMALLSLSFVFGGALALWFGGEVAALSKNNWRAVMAVPSLVLVALLLFSWLVLPKPVPRPAAVDSGVSHSHPDDPARESYWDRIKHVFAVRQLWIVLALSFGLTLFRETFNTWTVDFIKTEGGAAVSTSVAAFLATPFDLVGAVGIVALGWVFGRLSGKGRVRLLVTLLGLLALLLWNVPNFFRHGLWLVAVSVGLIGFLSYGPYSLLSGLLAVEIRGPAYVATVAGLSDGVGYVASILAGQQFGEIVDYGGYRLGFHVLAGIAAGCAVLCFWLYSGKDTNANS